jgi:hypothetical protein
MEWARRVATISPQRVGEANTSKRVKSRQLGWEATHSSQTDSFFEKRTDIQLGPEQGPL